ncbi:P-loop NTPase fold protein [uncultured Hoeflea sp.]|uniref:P-loop NTPase fold protein n=1 Tax=uncultured Hoeflea sp. TaxID=538666 RepID=UPI002603F51A|nr:P-loop NTPase fold protein [uncultured Hoeflea sp.]
MANALDITDRDSLERWLEDKPVEWAQLIASRAALRVFPLVLPGQDKPSNPDAARFQGLTLAVWRCLFISSVARKYPTDEMRANAAAYAATTNAAATAAAARATANAAAYAANAAAATTNAAATAAANAAAATTNAAATAAANAAAATTNAAATATTTARATVWEAIRCDCAILERDGPGRLETKPLWLAHDRVRGPDPQPEPEPVIATPDWVVTAMAGLTNDLTVGLLGPSAPLIADWYVPLLYGETDATWSRRFLGDRARDLALQDNAFWKVTEDRKAETIMGDIAAALRWESKSPQEQSEPNAPADEPGVREMATDVAEKFSDTSILEEGAKALSQKADELRSKDPDPDPEREPPPGPDPAPDPDSPHDPARAETAYIGDNVDGSVDYLQRSEIAFALAGQLNDVWDSLNPSPGPVDPFDRAHWTGLFKRRPKETLEPGFVVHVDAPWGGGKTTFAQYLTQILNPYRLPQLPDWLKALPLGDADKWKPSHRRPWHVVHFNAWQHEHVSPPWWVFYETIRKAATDAAVNETNQRREDPPAKDNGDVQGPAEPAREFGYDGQCWLSLLRRLEFWASETWWRLITPKVLTSLCVTAATVFAIWFLVRSGIFSLNFADLAKSGVSGKELPGALAALLVVLFGGGATIRTILSSFAQSLTPGTPEAANNYSMGSGDPLQRVRTHFERLTRRLNRPIIVIVDDLDRCNARFVTELVRGMQTILVSPRVVYVLLGDRDWVEHAFAEVNKEMKAIDVGPEHSFGGRFVEKAIQLSMVLPAMTEEVRESYVGYLLTRKPLLTPAAIEADPDASAPSSLAAQSDAPGQPVKETDAGSRVQNLEAVIENARRTAASPEMLKSVDFVEQQVREALSKASFKEREAVAQQVFKSLKADASGNLGLFSEQISRSFGRELDFLAVGDEGVEAQTGHMLLALSPALPPNPRQIKRILNTLTLNQQVMTKLHPEYRAGSNQWQQLARWVVLAVEWPMSWFTLTRHPQLADVVLAMNAQAPDAEQVEQALAKVDGDLSGDEAKALAAKLTATKPVIELLTFASEDKNWPEAPLDTEAINWLRQIMPATSGRMLEVGDAPEPKEPAALEPPIDGQRSQV